jgi:hypothetical protein
VREAVVPHLVPVDVYVKDGQVERVVINDIHVKLDTKAIEAGKRFLGIRQSDEIDEIVGICESVEAWPRWEFQ